MAWRLGPGLVVEQAPSPSLCTTTGSSTCCTSTSPTTSFFAGAGAGVGAAPSAAPATATATMKAIPSPLSCNSAWFESDLPWGALRHSTDLEGALCALSPWFVPIGRMCHTLPAIFQRSCLLPLEGTRYWSPCLLGKKNMLIDFSRWLQGFYR